MYSPLAPTPSRPPPPDPTADPASGFRGALPHRIAPRWGETWPDGSGHYGQWSWGEAGEEEVEGGRGRRARRRGACALAGRGTSVRLSPQPGSRGVRTPGNSESGRMPGAPSFLGRPCKAPPSPVDAQRRGPSSASRIPTPGALVPGVPEGAAATAQGRRPRREREPGGSRAKGRPLC